MRELSSMLESWGWSPGDWISLALSLFGAWFGVYSFLLVGHRVKVKAELVIRLHDGVLHIDLAKAKELPIEFLDPTSQPVLNVRARNRGRSPIDIEGVKIVNARNSSKPFLNQELGNPLPFRLEPGTSANWMFDYDTIVRVSHHSPVGESDKPTGIRAVVSLADDKEKKSKNISVSNYTMFWYRWQKLRGE